MKRLLRLLFLACLLLPMRSDASPLSLGDAFSVGETITSSKFNNKFNALSSWANGGVGSDNITDGSIADVDILSNTITGAKILDGTITAADLANDSVTADQIAAGVVGTSELADGGVATADIAVNATTQIFKTEEGTWTAGTCTGGTSMPTSNPGVNTALRVTTTAATTDERLVVHLWISVTCTSSCSGSTAFAYTCNYNTTEDASYGFIYSPNSGQPTIRSYMNSYTAATGGAKDLDCYIWRTATSAVSNYCARLVVEQVKR